MYYLAITFRYIFVDAKSKVRASLASILSFLNHNFDRHACIHHNRKDCRKLRKLWEE